MLAVVAFLASAVALGVETRETITVRCYSRERAEEIWCTFRGSSVPFGRGLARPSGTVTRPSDPLVVGPLATEEIEEVVEQHLPEIRYCYERRLPIRPALEGMVAVNFAISGIGTVPRASVASSTANDPALEACLTDRFRAMQFPAPRSGHSVVVRYPLRFALGSRAVPI